MMTQTHTLIAATLFAGRQHSARHNAAILFGSLVPDLAIFALFIWSKLAGIPERQLWREIYFSEPMLTFTAVGNSLPVYVLILIGGIFLVQKRTTVRVTVADQRASQEPISYWGLITSSAICLFALAAITHVLGDFPVHVSDAHPHFWPFSDWRFHSSISYWDRSHHGGLFSLLEGMLGIMLAVTLYRRFHVRWVRALTVLAILAYAAVPAYFILKLGS